MSITANAQRMNLEPLYDKVIIKLDEIEDTVTTGSGIIVPGTVVEASKQGVVVAIGGGKRNERGEILPLLVKVGDKVLLGRCLLNPIKVDGVEYSQIREDDIIGILT